MKAGCLLPMIRATTSSSCNAARDGSACRGTDGSASTASKPQGPAKLHHLEWLIGEPVPDPELVVYEVRPYAPAQADRIIEQLCVLAGLDVGQADHDPVRADRVRQGFRLIVGAAGARQALLDLEQIEREIGTPPWRDLLKELRHDRGRFEDAIRDKSVRIALRWALLIPE